MNKFVLSTAALLLGLAVSADAQARGGRSSGGRRSYSSGRSYSSSRYHSSRSYSYRRGSGYNYRGSYGWRSSYGRGSLPKRGYNKFFSTYRGKYLSKNYRHFKYRSWYRWSRSYVFWAPSYGWCYWYPQGKCYLPLAQMDSYPPNANNVPDMPGGLPPQLPRGEPENEEAETPPSPPPPPAKALPRKRVVPLPKKVLPDDADEQELPPPAVKIKPKKGAPVRPKEVVPKMPPAEDD
jgi:hypothetical protein